MKQHFYLNKDSLYKRIKQDYLDHHNLIIAVDFDDTIAPTSWVENCDEIVKLIKEWETHSTIIIFTANSNIEEVKEYCCICDIPFDYINENAPVSIDWYERNGVLKEDQPRKIYYNILLDDKAGLRESYKALKKLLREIKSGEIYR